MNARVWLRAEEAAVHLGYVKADGSPNLPAFDKFVQRQRKAGTLRVHWLGGRRRFRVVDLDACVESEPAPAKLRKVS